MSLDQLPAHIIEDQAWLVMHLPDVPSPTPAVVHGAGQRWVAASDLYVNLVAVDAVAARAAELSGDTPANERARAMKAVGDFLANTHTILPGDVVWTDEFRFAQDPQGARSIIRGVHVPELSGLFAAISDALQYRVLEQPTYVALYTGGNRRAVNLATDAQVVEFTRPMSPKQVASFRAKTNVGGVLR